MVWTKRAHTAETLKQPSPDLRLRASYFYPDRAFASLSMARSDRGMLGRWVKEFQEDESEAFRGNGKRSIEQEELRRLREENRRLKMERDILKKATAFFAKESS